MLARLHLVMATPLGHGGKGGIDRIVDELRTESRGAPGGVVLHVLTTRGQGHIALAPFHLATAIAFLLALRLVGRADLLHVHLSSHGSTWRKIALCAAARAARIPYVIHLHGSRYREFLDSAGPRAATRIKAMFRGAATVLVLGRTWRELLLRHMPDLGPRIRILPNASRVPTGASERADGPATILFLGRVGARKGVPVLLDALARLPKNGWRAVIAGDGELDAARAAVAGHGLADQVTLPGWVGPSDVDRLLRQADILVLPSRHENLPMSVIEGMAHGLTVVATPVGAVPDILAHDISGLLVAPGDVDGLAQALARAVADPALRAGLGQAARTFHCEHLELSSYYGRLLDIWTDAAAVSGKQAACPA